MFKVSWQDGQLTVHQNPKFWVGVAFKSNPSLPRVKMYKAVGHAKSAILDGGWYVSEAKEFTAGGGLIYEVSLHEDGTYGIQLLYNVPVGTLRSDLPWRK